MRNLHAEQTATIDASPEEVYAILANYRDTHPQILPKQYFSDLEVESGGTGAGTTFRVRTHVMGIGQRFHMVVREPKPGQVISETDTTSGLVTTFTVLPVDDGRRARVTIATDWQAQSGFKGLLERLTTPPIMRRIYATELRQIASYIAARRARTSSPA